MNTRNEEKVVHFVERFRTVVANEGFEGFFRADAGDHAQAMLNALLVMNAIKAAALLRRAMWLFDCGSPPHDQSARREALRKIDDNGRSILRQLDGSFRDYNEELATALVNYSRALEERYSVV